MHSISEIHGFPPLISEIEDFASELRQPFEQFGPVLIGGFAFSSLLVVSSFFLQ